MNQNASAEIFAALRQLERDRGIPVDYMTDRITQALLAAYKKDRVGYVDNVFVELTESSLKMYAQKEVVDEVLTPATEIQIDAARHIAPHCELGDLVNEEIQTQAFGRIAAQTAKQVIIQGIREAEHGMVYDKFSSKEHEIITATVSRIDNSSGDMAVRIGQGSDRTEAWLTTREQVSSEQYHEGDLIRVYVVEVRKGNRGPQIVVSRTHPGLVKRLFELNVPEIASGEVEIKSIAREAGSRTKLAVRAVDENLDPVGTCVGPKGSRVAAVVDELHGEKMDIVVWDEDPARFIAAALAPADVISVTMSETEKACRVIVPDDQLSLAIGKEGQNARLAARLTGHNIDIKPASQATVPLAEEEADPVEVVTEDAAADEAEIAAAEE
ncbi:MAG: transcription termination/antitermination protein NusA [Oscillospiraceae bacterium]|nr:transcription termination/antitermination protein NusA [Oscillospiraceae bacterium]